MIRSFGISVSAASVSGFATQLRATSSLWRDFMSANRTTATAIAALATAIAVGVFANPSSFAQPMGEKTVMVGGAAMFPSKNIIQNAVNSKDHTGCCREGCRPGGHAAGTGPVHRLCADQ